MLEIICKLIGFRSIKDPFILSSDYVEKASPNTLWLRPDRRFFRFSADEKAHVLPFAMKQENSYIKIIS